MARTRTAIRTIYSCDLEKWIRVYRASGCTDSVHFSKILASLDCLILRIVNQHTDKNYLMAVYEPQELYHMAVIALQKCLKKFNPDNPAGMRTLTMYMSSYIEREIESYVSSDKRYDRFKHSAQEEILPETGRADVDAEYYKKMLPVVLADSLLTGRIDVDEYLALKMRQLGFKFKDMAKHMSLPLGTTSSKYYTAVNKVAAYVKKEIGEY